MKILIAVLVILLTGCGSNETPEYDSLREKTEDGKDVSILEGEVEDSKENSLEAEASMRMESAEEAGSEDSEAEEEASSDGPSDGQNEVAQDGNAGTAQDGQAGENGDNGENQGEGQGQEASSEEEDLIIDDYDLPEDDPAQDYVGQRVQVDSSVNVRSGPSEDYDVLFTINPYTDFRIVEVTSEEWLLIEFDDYFGYLNKEAFENTMVEE